ncbi:DUF1489 family protein [Gemmobacter nectariphilus]|uniref:DUF1489 family protein n=1 Tax=Gemmobacter nectariphilus TaxID=220343 RepID=UPI000410EB0D|nr:DUF1489 domain-containing protein [Gemmobacter nectariphilus]
MPDPVNLVKLCVGADSVQDLLDWQDSQRHHYPPGRTFHITRMWPKREAEVLQGSLYWVFKGQILARQKILELQRVEGGDGIARCAIHLDARVIRTEPAARRPFQGWRYLKPEESPRDLPQARATDDSLPPDLAAALADIGLR